MEIYSHPDIPEILSLPGNNTCCDCNSEKPKWTSLNNGIFLCLKCAGIHRSLGLEISTIRSLQIDSWTDKQILYLSKGGNNKFKNILLEYKIDKNAQIEQKYKSKAADYYRKMLKNEVEKTSDKNYKALEPVKPSLDEGKEILDIKKGQEDVSNSNVIGAYDEPKKEEGFLNVFGSFLNNVKKTAGDVAGKIGKEIDDLKIGEKIKVAGGTVIDYAKAGGSYIKDKSEQALNSEFVQGITKKAESGINTVIEKTKILLNNDSNKKQNINPNLLKNNEIENENGKNIIKNDDLQMSDVVNNGNINNINNINDNINNEILNSIENKNEEIKKIENALSEPESKVEKNEEKKEESKGESKEEKQEEKKEESREESKGESKEEKQKEKKEESREESKEESKEEKKEESQPSSNENINNVIDNKKIEEESVKREPENPQNP